MAKQKKAGEMGREGMSGIDKLRLRVSAMINNPKARVERQATIWRLESDSDLAWNQVLEDLAETDGLEMTQNEDGTVSLRWEAPSEEDLSFEEMAQAPELAVQHLHDEAPF
ncbi:DUF1654 domain-containing protein [Pseudomonas nicosulfuronedens]|uniref:DUF1654 domain-containing protein n=1 Tax=Pseudomonas nicosulfuronedens TaxID=2571105 RepID=UPI0024487813|nr:DUF1654 domain-containing protein [Pseudomonas nicosulfuronedens]MDH1009977.1 DUF1654 domain-containing protein [Pseudomonas nicosulfuronedens]MDH1978953.1 DUF1654 domain-containing protein [Pseudomonas nicosulfuronedens]MDH2028368.1 DUF1654 domain-containing protein [Pseudomonas nicosulfuronedens]